MTNDLIPWFIFLIFLSFPFIVFFYSKIECKILDIAILIMPVLTWLLVGLILMPRKSISNAVVEPYLIFMLSEFSFLLRRFNKGFLSTNYRKFIFTIMLCCVAMLMSLFFPIIPE